MWVWSSASKFDRQLTLCARAVELGTTSYERVSALLMVNGRR
jgi:hypothetical protein